MRITAKIVFMICICPGIYAQQPANLNPGGLFTLFDTIPIDSSFVISPGALSKDGNLYVLGLSTGGREPNGDPVRSDLYSINVDVPDADQMVPVPMHMFNSDSVYQFYQCSLSDQNKTLVFVINKGAGWDKNDLAIAEKDASEFKFSSYRKLDEINDTSASDAYPWISGDSKRLYFTRNYRLMYSERNSLSDKFSTPKYVEFAGDIQLDIISVWLTSDELTMYILADSRIYKSTRKNKSDEFGFPALLTDEFKDLYFLAGMSFTPDRKTMFVFYYDGTNDYMLIYKLLKGKI